MLTSEEVYDIMRKDFLELQRKRIKELEDMIVELLGDYQCAASCAEIEGYPTEYSKLSEKADKIVKKGVSL